jgi:hypothetical protein
VKGRKHLRRREEERRGNHEGVNLIKIYSKHNVFPPYNYYILIKIILKDESRD